MSDPHNLGLNDLGQRVQAMAEPVTEQRPRPPREAYQGAPLPIGPASGTRYIPPYEAFEDLRVTPPPVPPQAISPTGPHAGNNGATPLAHPGAAFAGTVPPPVPATPQPIAQAFTPVNAPPAPPAPPANLSANAPANVPESASSQGSTGTPATDPLTGAAMPDDPNTPKSGLQRAVIAVRAAIPVIQKLLPLLDGNFATAVGAMLVPQPQTHTPPPQVKIDLEPVERTLAEIRAGQRDLRGQALEQISAFKRVEDQLERVREATDRNTLEQQELVEDLRAVGSRISTLAIVGLVVLVLLLGINAWFLFQLQHILR